MLAMKTPIPESVQIQVKEMIAYANDHGIILSLLYDLDLMPEQVDEGTPQWADMLNIISHFRTAIDDASKPSPGP
jgi:hypothetical protein